MDEGAAVRALVTEGYRLPGALAIDVQARVAAWTVRVSSSEQRWWLRLERTAFRSRAMVELEAELVASLQSAACSVAAPVRRADGVFASVLVLGGEEVAGFLAEEASGATVIEPTVAQACALGRALAEMHRRGDGTLATRRLVIDTEYLVHEPLRKLAATVPGNWYEHAGLELLASRLATLAWSEVVEPLPEGLCHGDVHLDNVCFQDATPTWIDFAECGYGPSAYDLACYWRKRILANASGPSWSAEWHALLHGYGSVRKLETRELRAIPALATLRAIRTMALPALPGCEAWGSAWLRDPAYFRAHLEMIDRLGSALSAWPN